MSGLLGGVVMLPLFEDLLKIALFVTVIIIAVLFHFFIFWNKLQDRFVTEIFPKFLLQLYKSDDFVEYLVEKHKRKKKHED